MELRTMPLRFRMWDTTKHNFAFFDLLNPEILNSICLDPDRYIISQDTGLKDKNGKSIFTGDIVVHDNRYSMPAGVVHYNKRGSKIVFNEFNDSLYNSHKLIEVIGNIWQNGELLEEA